MAQLATTFAGQSNHDIALSLSKGGSGLQACFDKLSTGLPGWIRETHSVVDVRGLTP
jgi:hypothetical protein